MAASFQQLQIKYILIKTHELQNRNFAEKILIKVHSQARSSILSKGGRQNIFLALHAPGCVLCLLIKLHSFLCALRTQREWMGAVFFIVNFMHSRGETFSWERHTESTWNYHQAMRIINSTKRKTEKKSFCLFSFFLSCLFCIYSNYKKNVRNTKQTFSSCRMSPRLKEILDVW